MITDIRKTFKSPVYRFVWLAIVASFGAGLVVPVLFRSSLGMDPWAFRVNGSDIPYKEYVREVRSQEQYLSSLRGQYGRHADLFLQMMGIPTDSRAAARDQLIRGELLSQASKAVGIVLHHDYVTEMLHNPAHLQGELATFIPPYVLGPEGMIDQSLLADYLHNRGVSMTEFEKAVEQILEREQLALLVQSLVHVPRYEKTVRFAERHGAKTFVGARASLESLIAQEKQSELSNQELKEFYLRESRESGRYWIPEKRSGYTWRFDARTYGITVSDQDVEEYYQDHKLTEFQTSPARVTIRRILIKDDEGEQAARENAEELLAQVQANPSQFAAVARASSHDELTASNGGLLEPFTRADTEHDRAIIKAGFLLKEDGAISDLLRTRAGYEIVQRVSKQDAVYEPLSKVRERIKEKLARRKFRDVFSADIGRVLRAQRDEGDERAQEVMTTFATQKGVTSQEVQSLARDDSPLAQQLFTIGEGDFGFALDESGATVVKLTAIERKQVAPFDTIQEDVRADLYEQRARERMQKLLKDARADMLAGNVQKVREEGIFSLETFGPLVSDDQQALSRLKERGLPVETMMAFEKEGLTLSHVGDREGWVIRLDEVRVPTSGPTAEQAQAILQETEGHYGSLFYEGFVASLRRNATLETNEQIAIPS